MLGVKRRLLEGQYNSRTINAPRSHCHQQVSKLVIGPGFVCSTPPHSFAHIHSDVSTTELFRQSSSQFGRRGKEPRTALLILGFCASKTHLLYASSCTNQRSKSPNRTPLSISSDNASIHFVTEVPLHDRNTRHFDFLRTTNKEVGFASYHPFHVFLRWRGRSTEIIWSAAQVMQRTSLVQSYSQHQLSSIYAPPSWPHTSHILSAQTSLKCTPHNLLT